MPLPTTYRAARDLLSGRLSASASVNRAFYDGDHWQNATGWIGDLPPIGQGYEEITRAIRAGFLSQNMIASVVNRHVAAVLEREAYWSLVPARGLALDERPTADEQARIDEAEAALGDWWDERNVPDALQHSLVWALLTGGGPLRLYVPAGRHAQLADEAGRVRVASLADAFDVIQVETLAPDRAGTFVDPDTHETYSVTLLSSSGQPAIEIARRDPSGLTVLTLVRPDAADSFSTLALGGALPVGEVRRTPLIDDQICKAQRGINLALTQMVRNVNFAGSRDRTYLNAKPPGEWVDSVTGQPWTDRSTGTRVWRWLPLPTGAGVDRFIQGAEIVNAAGQIIGYANPNVSVSDPVPVSTFVDTHEELRRAILDAVQQLHVLIAGDAMASGESRKQARVDFVSSTRVSKRAVDAAGRWLIRCALSLAASMAGQPDRYADLRVEFAAQVSTGALSADEQREVIQQFQAGLLSRETALTRLGHEDVDAELARIAAEQNAAGSPLTESVLRAFNAA